MPEPENGDYRKGRSHLAAIPIQEQQLAPYIDDFDYVFNEKDARNIALSGPFAAGKSSVMLGWEQFEKEKRKGNGSSYLHVSLAEDAKRSGNDEREIEARLVNQLVQKIDPKKVKKTGLRRYEDIGWKTAALRSAAIGVALSVICLISYLFGIENWLVTHPLRSVRTGVLVVSETPNPECFA
ncbi:hypothetical protein [Adlercreutzia sp. ZJ473]|uniref:YobI family P-loop NTPase n=1 Tax=Adlercreutzia sp. ZJ473 TaxID=2722822 RepID=UPI001552200E|nr:hypothetical protein [Adlercreutzia sp. ZJ473]